MAVREVASAIARLKASLEPAASTDRIELENQLDILLQRQQSLLTMIEERCEAQGLWDFDGELNELQQAVQQIGRRLDGD
ncbi:MAG: hypothetical protein P8010_01380 [Desulfosarcinaceae bacterium]